MKDLVNFLNHKEMKELKHVEKTEPIKHSSTTYTKLKDKIFNKESFKKLNE